MRPATPWLLSWRFRSDVLALTSIAALAAVVVAH